MLVERADIMVREGMADAMLTALRDEATPLLQGVAGVGQVAIGRGVGNPDKVTLVVTWASMAAYEAFRASPAHLDLRAVLGPYATGGAMEHFEME